MFYAENIKEGDSYYTLNEEESKHCVRVLRLRVGDVICITNGRGVAFSCKIVSDHDKRCEVQITDVLREDSVRDKRLHVAIAPTKNIERVEWFIEKAVEVGIDRITMLLCENSERDSVKVERLNKVAIAAMKQSLRYTLPEITVMTKFSDFIKRVQEPCKLIAHCEADIEREYIKDAISGEMNILIMIGPEGDFSRREIEQAVEMGFRSISLGDARLRTETAAVVSTIIVDYD